MRPWPFSVSAGGRLLRGGVGDCLLRDRSARPAGIPRGGGGARRPRRGTRPECSAGLLDTSLLIYLLASDQAADPSVSGRLRQVFQRAAAGGLALVVTPVVALGTLPVLEGLGVPPRGAPRLVGHVPALPDMAGEEEHVLSPRSRYSG